MVTPRDLSAPPHRDGPRPRRRRLLRLALPAAAPSCVTGSVVGVSVARGGQHAPVRAADVAAKPMKVTVPSGDDSLYLADRLRRSPARPSA